jgi:uncharacterized protein (TIGR04255 family)
MYEQLCYQKAFLNEVIARLDFVAPLEGFENSFPSKLANVISTHFPISEPTETIAQELQLTADALHHRETRFKQWNFFGKEREKQVTIAAPFLYVSYKRYTTYEDMKANFSAVIDAMKKVSPDAKVGRFGLRYINNIEISDLSTPTSWDEYISKPLLETIPFFKTPSQLTRLFHIAELKIEELDVRFQFGMPNPDFPAIMKRPLFVLDFDAYVQTAHELNESIQHMEKAHTAIQSLFEDSITDKLRSKMNVKPTTSV